MMHSFHLQLFFVSFVSFISILLPIVMDWNIAVLSSDEIQPIIRALQSNEYQVCLVIGVSVSAPMFLELLIKGMSARLEFDLTSTVIISSLAIPDLIVLTYVRVALDLNTFNFIIKSRNILLLWFVLVLVKKYGGKQWSHVRMVSCFILLSTGRVTAFYKAYYTNGIKNTLAVLGVTCDAGAFIILIIMSIRWYRFILRRRKIAVITTNQHMCNAYVTATLIAFSGIYLNLYSTSRSPEWYDWDARKLCVFSMSYTAFYLTVMVFEGRVLQREMLETKVNIFFFFLFFLRALCAHSLSGGATNEVDVYPLHLA